MPNFPTMSDLPSEIKNDLTQTKSLFDRIKYYVIITIIFLAILLMRECQNSRDKVRLIKNISTYSDSAHHYTNKYKQQVSYNQTLDFESKAQLKAYFYKNDSLTNAIKNFKTVLSIVTDKQYVYIHDTVGIKYEENIPCSFKPFDVVRDTTYYRFRGTIYQDKFKIDSLFIPNNQTIIVGEKKVGLFKKEHRIEVTNSNPYLITTNLGSYTVTDKKKWWQHPLINFGVGIVGGYVIGVSSHK